MLSSLKDIKIHSSITASIKDSAKDVDISDPYWNRLFVSLTELFDTVYFRGHLIGVKDDEFDQTIDYLSDEVLIDEKNRAGILLRLKTSFMQHKRRFVNRLWNYYEYPGFIFLGDKEDEEILLSALKNRMFFDEINQNVDNTLMIYREAELDVLWFQSNIEIGKYCLFCR